MAYDIANLNNLSDIIAAYQQIIRSSEFEQVPNFDKLHELLEKLINLTSSWHHLDDSANKSVVLMPPMYHWLKTSHTKLFDVFDSANKQIIFTPHYTNFVKELPELTPDNYQDYFYNGVPVWSCVAYSVAVSLRCSLAEIDAHNPTHWQCIQGYAGLTASYIELFQNYITFFKPTKIITTQGYFYTSAIQRHMGLIHGVPVVAIENTLHKEKMIYDDISAITVTRNSVRNIFWRTQDHIMLDEAKNFTADYVANIKAIKQSEHRTPADRSPMPAKASAQQKTVLYLGQVGTDSSVLFDIVGFKNQAALIAAVADNVCALGHRLVVKLHPKELHGRDPVKLEPYEQLTYQWLKAYPNFQQFVAQGQVVLDAENVFDTYQLIDEADLCVTINSQAGLEAAIIGREVVLCGRAFYGALGFTHDVQGVGDLADTLRRLLSHEGADEFVNKNPLLAQKFFFSFLNYSCLPRTAESLLKIV